MTGGEGGVPEWSIGSPSSKGPSMPGLFGGVTSPIFTNDFRLCPAGCAGKYPLLPKRTRGFHLEFLPFASRPRETPLSPVSIRLALLFLLEFEWQSGPALHPSRLRLVRQVPSNSPLLRNRWGSGLGGNNARAESRRSCPCSNPLHSRPTVTSHAPGALLRHARMLTMLTARDASHRGGPVGG